MKKPGYLRVDELDLTADLKDGWKGNWMKGRWLNKWESKEKRKERIKRLDDWWTNEEDRALVEEGMDEYKSTFY